MIKNKTLIFLHQYKYFIIIFLIFLFRLFTICNVFESGVEELATCRQRIIMQQDQKISPISQAILNFRTLSAQKVRKYFPSPHSELLLGLIFGINDLSSVPTFNDVLRTTGTIHVVVVSGYNISLVFSLVIGVLGSQYKLRNLITALAITLIYALISGFDPPVVRAYVMGSMVAISKLYGRLISAKVVLIFSALLMLAISPTFILSLSFQLSFLATFGLILYSPLFEILFQSSNVLIRDLISTLSAQVLVWPLISYHFEQVSLISPLVNALTLWTIPIATILGGIFAISTLFDAFLPFLPRLFYFIAVVPHDIFIRSAYFFANTPYAVVDFKPGITFLVIYYFLVLVISQIKLKPYHEKA